MEFKPAGMTTSQLIDIINQAIAELGYRANAWEDAVKLNSKLRDTIEKDHSK